MEISSAHSDGQLSVLLTEVASKPQTETPNKLYTVIINVLTVATVEPVYHGMHGHCVSYVATSSLQPLSSSFLQVVIPQSIGNTAT